MKLSRLIAVCLLLSAASLAFGQTIHYDYDRDANFASYKTYQWIEVPGGIVPNQLQDQNIKRAIDAELQKKGLQKVERNGDLHVGYEAAVDKEKQLNSFSMGPRWWGGGMGQATTSTISVGKLVVDMYDPARKQLVWRGDATKTLNPSRDPDKNYRNLEKSMAKLFKNYPPKARK